MRDEKNLALLQQLGAIAEGIATVLKELGGDKTVFLLYVQNEHCGGVVGNVSELHAITALRRMIAECEKRAVNRAQGPADKHAIH